MRSCARSAPRQRSQERVPATWNSLPMPARIAWPSGDCARAEADRADRLPIATAQAGPDMAVSDDPGIDDAVARQGEDRLRRALPERAGALDQADGLGGGAPRAARRPSRRSASTARASATAWREVGRQEGGEAGQVAAREGHAGGHGVAAALHRDARPRRRRGPRGRDRHPRSSGRSRSPCRRAAGRRRRPDGRSAPSGGPRSARRCPGCQPALPATSTGRSGSRPRVRSISASASATASASITCRSRFSRSSSTAMRAASAGSSVVSRRAPSPASPMRPPALMRGPSR